MSYFQIYTDGGSRGNPGEAGIGLVIYDGTTGDTIYELGEYIGKTTNNVAEYTALIRAMEIAADLGGSKLEVFADSELMIKQLNGIYKVKNEGLIPLHRQIRLLAGKFQSCRYTHVRREKNKRADSLANLAMDKKGTVGGAKRGEKPIAEASEKLEHKASGQQSTQLELVMSDNASIKHTSDDVCSKRGQVAEVKQAVGGVLVGDVPELAFAYATPFAPSAEIVPMVPGIFRETLAVGAQIMQLKTYLLKGSTLPPHTHFHEQTSFILIGKIKFKIADSEHILTQGQVIVFPGDQEHGAEVLEDTIILETFVPVRNDYL